MLETESMIQQTLALAGEPLVFSSGIIYGIPGEDLYDIQGYNSPYDIKKQSYIFQVSANDLVTNGIKARDTFTYTVGTRQFTFSVLSFPEDLTGWAMVAVNLESIADV